MQNSAVRILVLQAGNADFAAAACAEKDMPGCFICKAESQAAQVRRALIKKKKHLCCRNVYMLIPPRRDRTLLFLFLWLLSCQVRRSGPVEIACLVPRVASVVLQWQSPFGPLGPVSESVAGNGTPKFSQSDRLPPSVSTGAILSFLGLWLQTSGHQQTNRQMNRASVIRRGFPGRSHTGFSHRRGPVCSANVPF